MDLKWSLNLITYVDGKQRSFGPRDIERRSCVKREVDIGRMQPYARGFQGWLGNTRSQERHENYFLEPPENTHPACTLIPDFCSPGCDRVNSYCFNLLPHPLVCGHLSQQPGEPTTARSRSRTGEGDSCARAWEGPCESGIASAEDWTQVDLTGELWSTGSSCGTRVPCSRGSALLKPGLTSYWLGCQGRVGWAGSPLQRISWGRGRSEVPVRGMRCWHLEPLGNRWTSWKRGPVLGSTASCMPGVQSPSHVWLLTTPWTAAHQASCP